MPQRTTCMLVASVEAKGGCTMLGAQERFWGDSEWSSVP
jgi:hypothetical protein